MKKSSSQNAKLSNHNESSKSCRETQSDGKIEVEKRQMEEVKSSIEEMTLLSITAMKQASQAVADLAKARVENKLSNSRIVSVARELKELIKVMSLYSY